MKKYIYFNPSMVHNRKITPTIFNSAKEVIKISSNLGNYETYYGGMKIQAKEGEIFEHYGELLEYIENHSFWHIDTSSEPFNRRLEEIREEYPECFI